MGSDADAGWKSRFLDYFMVCGMGVHLKSTRHGKGWHGVSTDGEKVRYEPSLVERFPETDHKDFEIPALLAQVRDVMVMGGGPCTRIGRPCPAGREGCFGMAMSRLRVWHV